MNSRHLVIAAATGSALLLIAALGFQYLGGLAPCQLCIWQRWPHAAAVAIGAGILIFGAPKLAWAGALAATATAAIALYHAGVEYAWWKGLEACSATPLEVTSGAELLDFSAAQPVVLCDEVVWSFLGLSMASWNGILSLVLVGIWIASLHLHSRLGTTGQDRERKKIA